MNRNASVVAVLAAASLLFLLYYISAERRIREAETAASSAISAYRAGGEPQLIVYNRIPKTASTTFMHLPYELCEKNGFNVLLLNISRPQHFLTFADQAFFARNVTGWKEKLPAMYHGHFAYIDFENLGVATPRPVWINLVRRPLDRLVSYYYFLRYGDDFRVNKIRSRMGNKMTFDECVEKKLSDCDPKRMWVQIPWFCGYFKKCWEPGNRWALEQAKHNLATKYFLVGLTDEVESFIEILESTLPSYFRGASKMFRESDKLQHIRKTKFKEEPSPETVAKMEDSKVWRLENEFYEFAQAQFSFVKAEFEQSGGARMFHYEKIRPR